MNHKSLIGPNMVMKVHKKVTKFAGDEYERRWCVCGYFPVTLTHQCGSSVQW